MRRLILALFLSALALLSGCGESGEDTSLVDASGSQPEYDLIKVDSIGIDIGDSNYVFGAVVDGGYLLDGRIALLDILKKKVSIFSGSGDFIRCAGCGGNGPGEFQAPCAAQQSSLALTGKTDCGSSQEGGQPLHLFSTCTA